MSLSTTYANINSLSDISFIAGSIYTIKFIVTNQSGSPVDLSTATCKWAMSPYGTDYIQLSKTGSVISSNEFDIILSPSDTAGLSGKFTHQPSITFTGGVKIIPAQGIITLIKGLS